MFHPVVSGTASEEILDFAAEQDSDLIVMGRHGPQGLQERLVGSVTDKVLRRTPVPVLTTSYEGAVAVEAVDFDSLLVPTDGSDMAEAATPAATALASQFDATIDVVNVIDLLVEAGPFDAGGVSEDFIEKLEANGTAAVERVADRIHDIDPSLDVTTTITRGRPHQELREYVETSDIDLVVMGSHGHSGVRTGLLGSVTTHMLQLVDVPVLVVPARE